LPTTSFALNIRPRHKLHSFFFISVEAVNVQLQFFLTVNQLPLTLLCRLHFIRLFIFSNFLSAIVYLRYYVWSLIFKFSDLFIYHTLIFLFFLIGDNVGLFRDLWYYKIFINIFFVDLLEILERIFNLDLLVVYLGISVLLFLIVSTVSVVIAWVRVVIVIFIVIVLMSMICVASCRPILPITHRGTKIGRSLYTTVLTCILFSIIHITQIILIASSTLWFIIVSWISIFFNLVIFIWFA